MRVRLLIDVEIKDVPALAALIKGQPPTWIEINSPHVAPNSDYPPVAYGGRLMGATPVEAGDQ